MKSARIVLATVTLLAIPCLYAQDADTKAPRTTQTDVKEKGQDDDATAVLTAGNPIRVQIVISEFDGTQKISSLPYAFNMLGTTLKARKNARLRFGVRVPVSSGADSFTYQDVGTNIDCEALQRDDGTYRLDLTVDRSSITMPMKSTDWKPGETNPSTQPLIRSFRDDFTVVAKPGQTIEGTSAVDPVSGHVVKVEVTLNALK
jgi:hypothetical protein